MNYLLAPFALGFRKGGVSALGEVTCMEMNLIAFRVDLSARAGGSEDPQLSPLIHISVNIRENYRHAGSSPALIQIQDKHDSIGSTCVV